jgi:ankyrin repeat protein
MATIQQRLFTCCRSSVDTDHHSCSLLKSLLSELDDNNQQFLVDIEDDTDRSLLFYAIESGKSLDFLRQLLDYRARLTSRILLASIRYGTFDLLRLLHRYGANFRQTHHGLSLLHECILLHKNHFIRFLIEQGDVSDNRE